MLGLNGVLVVPIASVVLAAGEGVTFGTELISFASQKVRHWSSFGDALSIVAGIFAERRSSFSAVFL